MTIHSEHPFTPAPGDRDQLRRVRGRLGSQVTLWTAGSGAGRTGLTVSSFVVALGDPGHVVGMLDPDSDLALDLTPGTPFVVQLLTWRHRDLSEQFAGTMPAPGGPFARAVVDGHDFEQTEFGPRLAGASAWLGCRVVDQRPVGWSTEVLARVERVEVGEDRDPLVHRRGRYVRPDGGTH